jgi:hypothetical protein
MFMGGNCVRVDVVDVVGAVEGGRGLVVDVAEAIVCGEL